MAEQSVDPFARRTGYVARIATHLRCTEGQLYSMVIGLLLLWAVSANALPHVVWDRGGDPDPVPLAAAPEPTPDTPASPAIVPEAAPEPSLSPVTVPSPSTGPAAPSEPAPMPAPDAPAPDADTGALRIERAGYATASAGTPLASIGVPEGSVAVGRRAGQRHSVTYLDLAGRGSTLELAVDGDGANVAAGLGTLELCVVTDAWDVGHGDTSLQDAPEPRCEGAVSGEPSADGSRWSFDVRSLDLDGHGFAVVPAEGSRAPEFQIVFRV